MERGKLHAHNIILGIFFTIVFFPILAVLPVVGGHIWCLHNCVLNKEVLFSEFENSDICGAVQELVLENAVDADNYDETAMEAAEGIIESIIHTDIVKDAFSQIFDAFVEGKSMDSTLVDRLRSEVYNALINTYDSKASLLLDEWLAAYAEGGDASLYYIDSAAIEEKLCTLAAESLGVSRNFITKDAIREYLRENPLSAEEKELVLKECRTYAEEYAEIASEEIADFWEENINAPVNAISESEEFEKYGGIVRNINKYANEYILACILIFAFFMVILIITLKARKAAFIIPAVAAIIASLAYFAEYLAAVWLSAGSLEKYGRNAEKSEKIVIEFATAILSKIESKILVFGAGALILALLLIIVGCIIGTIVANYNRRQNYN